MLLPQARAGQASPACTISLSAGVRQDLRLLEADDALLADICARGAVFKGPLGGEAVLCTNDKTYAVKTVETTNSLLLVSGAEALRAQGGGATLAVAATAGAHLELVQAQPRLGNLDAVLQATRYEGEDARAGDEPDPRPPWSYAALLTGVQASGSELRAALAQRSACDLDGRWQVPSQEYAASLLALLLLTAQHQGWPLTSLPAGEAGALLSQDGHDPRLVHHCLATFGTRCPAAADLWSLDEGKVCRQMGIEVLRAQRTWPLAAFMQRWREAAPEGMEPALHMLRGEALIDGDTVTRFPAGELPVAAAQRFAALFAVRALWEREALEPYIADLNSPGQSAEALLLDHARAVQSSTALLYGARHAGLAAR